MKGLREAVTREQATTLIVKAISREAAVAGVPWMSHRALTFVLRPDYVAETWYV